MNQNYYLIFSNEKSKSIAIVGCKGGQILVIKFAEMNAYDQQNDLSLPAELEYIKVNKIPKLDGSRLQASVNYCIDLSGKSDSHVFAKSFY